MVDKIQRGVRSPEEKRGRSSVRVQGGLLGIMDKLLESHRA